MDFSCCIDVTLLQHCRLRVLFYFGCFLAMTCIKCAITYSIFKYFINIISKTIIKYLFNGGKLLRKNQDNTFILHWHFQISELIRKSNKSFLLCAFCTWRICGKQKNVGKIPCFVDVAKEFPCLCWSFATPNVHKLVVCQIKHNNGYFLLHKHSVFFLSF